MLLSPPPDSPSRDLSRNNWTRAGSPLPGGVEGRKSPGWVEPSLALPSHSFLLKKKQTLRPNCFLAPPRSRLKGQTWAQTPLPSLIQSRLGRKNLQIGGRGEAEGEIRDQGSLPGGGGIATGVQNVEYCCCWSVTKLCPTLPPHGVQYARLPCPSPSPCVCSNSHPLSR